MSDLEPEQKPLLVIDMVLDPICPWCYVGFRALDWCMMKFVFSHALLVRYRPYRLDPDTPPWGRDRATTLATKFPSQTYRDAMNEALATAKADVKLTFDPEKPTRIPDTTNAHRVMRWSHEDGRQREILVHLFEAYWGRGADIGNLETLAALAELAGMDGDDVLERLKSDEDVAAVKEEAAEFRGDGLDGVPTFVVNERAGFTGAIPKSDMFDQIRKLSSEVPAPQMG